MCVCILSIYTYYSYDARLLTTFRPFAWRETTLPPPPAVPAWTVPPGERALSVGTEGTRTTTVCLLALQRGNGAATLIDAEGRILCRSADIDRLRPASRRVARQALWALWADGQRNRGNSRAKASVRQLIDPWEAKAECWCVSLRLRRREQPASRRRGIWQGFPTHTWADALPRLWYQARAQWDRGRRTPWERWARTARRNLAKRRNRR